MIGISEEQDSDAPVSWWDDTLSLARVGAGSSRATAAGLGSRQVEFWVDEDLKQQQPAAVRETRAEYRAEAVKPSEPERFSVKLKGATKQTGGAVSAAKGMGRVNIARFLTVNGGVYDGRDHQRWMALPERERGLRFQFMKQRDMDLNADLKVSRSLPRDFGGASCR